MSFIKFENIVKLFTKYWEKFLVTGVSYTLLLAAITVAFGAVIACLLAGMKLSRIAPLRWLSTAYIEIIRGTPMLLQLYFFYFALPALIPALNKQKFLCITIALVCNSAAYVSEVIRSGIQSVDAGQSEAAMSLGMNSFQRTWYILVPQALKTILPARARQRVYHDREGHLARVHVLYRRSHDTVSHRARRKLSASGAARDRRRHLFYSDVPAQQTVRIL